VFLVLAAAASACGSPTDAKTARHLTIEGGPAMVAGGELVPFNVETLEREFQFNVTPLSSGVVHGLYYSCPDCEAFDGQRVPKPAFSRTARWDVQLPTGVISAVASTSAASVTVQNHFAFDPIRPAAGVTGSITALFISSSGSDTLGRLTIDGTTHSLPPGSSLSMQVPLTGLLRPFSVQFTYASPAGDSVTMSGDQSISLAAAVNFLRAASMEVRVTGRPITATAALDLTNLEGITPEQLDSAHVLVTMKNTFAVSGPWLITLAATGTNVSRSFPFASGSSNELFIRLDGAEAVRLAGRSVTLSIIGSVTASDPITVTPSTPVTVASTQFTLFATQ
jgi:hypothetical protein